MKKIIISFTIVLIGCAEILKPSETIRSEKCLDFDKMKVLQATDNGILAHLCPDNYPSYYRDAFEACIVHGDLVFMSIKKQDNDYVDNQKLQLSGSKCFVSDGVYKYTTRQEIDKTVRKIKIIDSQIKNPAYKEWLQEQDNKKK